MAFFFKEIFRFPKLGILTKCDLTIPRWNIDSAYWRKPV